MSPPSNIYAYLLQRHCVQQLRLTDNSLSINREAKNVSSALEPLMVYQGKVTQQFKHICCILTETPSTLSLYKTKSINNRNTDLTSQNPVTHFVLVLVLFLVFFTLSFSLRQHTLTHGNFLSLLESCCSANCAETAPLALCTQNTHSQSPA